MPTKLLRQIALPATAGAGIIIVLLLPTLLPNRYWLHLLNVAGIYVVAVLGLNFILGYAGQISIGHAAFFGIGGYASALLMINAGMPFLASFLFAGMVCGLVGLLVGFPTLRLRGPYLAFATIGLGEVTRLSLINLTDITGGAQGIKNIPPPSLGPIEIATEQQSFYFILALVSLATIIALLIERSKLGRSFMAVRESEIAADCVGVNTSKAKLLAFSLSAIFGGLAGSLYAHFIGYISPDTYGTDLSIVLLTMLILGGMGTVPGSILGAIVVTFLPEWMRFLQSSYMMFYAAGVLILVIFLPTGAVGGVQRLLAWRTARIEQTKQQQETQKWPTEQTVV